MIHGIDDGLRGSFGRIEALLGDGRPSSDLGGSTRMRADVSGEFYRAIPPGNTNRLV